MLLLIINRYVFSLLNPLKYEVANILPIDFFAGLEFFETSAKENINVKAVFERLVDIICDKMSESLDQDPSLVNSQTKGTRLTENTAPEGGSCQC